MVVSAGAGVGVIVIVCAAIGSLTKGDVGACCCVAFLFMDELLSFREFARPALLFLF